MQGRLRAGQQSVSPTMSRRVPTRSPPPCGREFRPCTPELANHERRIVVSDEEARHSLEAFRHISPERMQFVASWLETPHRPAYPEGDSLESLRAEKNPQTAVRGVGGGTRPEVPVLCAWGGEDETKGGWGDDEGTKQPEASAQQLARWNERETVEALPMIAQGEWGSLPQPPARLTKV
jgi:hypothetical protein